MPLSLPRLSPSLRSLLCPVFRMRAVVWVRDPGQAANPAFVIPARRDWRCVLLPLPLPAVQVDAVATTRPRKRLAWPADETLPDRYCQIEIAGERWNVAVDTVDAVNADDGSVLYHIATVEREVG